MVLKIDLAPDTVKVFQQGSVYRFAVSFFGSLILFFLFFMSLLVELHSLYAYDLEYTCAILQSPVNTTQWKSELDSLV